MRRFALLVCLAGCGVNESPPPIVSTFANDSEGWWLRGFYVEGNDFTVSDMRGSAPMWDATAAALKRTDLVGLGDYFEAPKAFLGDLSAYEGGTLRFRLREESTSMPFAAPLVILAGVGGRWRFDHTIYADTDWFDCEVPLDFDMSGWTRLDGGIATSDAFRASLGSVTGLWLRGEFSSAIVSAWIDDVTLR